MEKAERIHIRDFRKRIEITQRELSEQVGVIQSRVSRYESDGLSIPKRIRQTILDRYNVEIYNNYKSPGLSKAEQLARERIMKEIREDPRGKPIPYFETEVFASVRPGFTDAIALRPETFVNIPMFSRGEFAIQITGNSMKGYINHGDWCVIRKLNDIHRINYGEPYVVISRANLQRTVKFINSHEDNSLYWLSSYNVEQFQSYEIEKEDILELYEVIGIFRKLG